MRPSEIVLNVLTAVTALSALTMTTVVLRRDHAPPPPGVIDAKPHRVSEWQQYARTGRLIGPPNAALTIVEFGDFQYPACRAFFSVTEKLRQKHPNDVAVVVRIVALATLISPAVMAQQEDANGTTTGGAPCGTLYYYCGGDGYSHTVTGSPTVGSAYATCYWCVSNNQNVEAYPNCHSICSGSIPDSTKRYYVAALEAGRRGMTGEVVKAGMRAPDYVAFNAARNVVEIRSCTKEVIIAILPVRTAEERRLAASLPAERDQLVKQVATATPRVSSAR